VYTPNLRLLLPILGLLFLLACRSDPKTEPAPPAGTTAPAPPPAGPPPAQEPPFTQEGVLEFRAPGAAKSLLRLDIEIASDNRERNQGLMWRKKMQEKQGMLFVFEFEGPQSFWMHNTYIPLDIIFVNDRFEVVSIRKNTPVLNDTPQPSGAPARYVIEVNAGVADKYGIVPGTKVAWSDFITGQPAGEFEVKAL
jgi:uncharacterized membrane protein (UPF0127 family)